MKKAVLQVRKLWLTEIKIFVKCHPSQLGVEPRSLEFECRTFFCYYTVVNMCVSS